jgi:ABC-type transport system involved in multi-copper enzyme maturation permease subunit
MTAAGHGVRKDVQALAPMWVATGAAIGAAPLWAAFHFEIVAVMAYVFGSVAIGAHVIGHEYAHRTVGSLLAQPVSRTSILGLKLGVLAVALLSLAAVASIGLYSPIARFPDRAALDSRVVYLPTLMGLTLAPYLAMLARSTLGGAVFAIAVPGVALVAADLVGVWWFGPGLPSEIDRFKFTVFPAATVLACVAAAVAIWPRFNRLEALGDEAGHVTVSMPGRAPAPASRTRRSPYWLLTGKELRLQQMTFVVVALYVCAWGAGLWLQRSPAVAPFIPWWQLNTLYAGLLGVLIGSLASAEERQLRTLEWQALLPVASWKQFAVKVAVASALALVAGIGLPILLAQLAPLPHLGGFPRGAVWMLSVIVLGLAIGSLYVSTLASSGARAVATALPALAGAVVLMRTVELLWWQTVRAGLISRRAFSDWAPRTEDQMQWAMTIIAAGIGAVCLALAYRNHAAMDGGTKRVSTQAAAIAGALVAAGTGMFVVQLR